MWKTFADPARLQDRPKETTVPELFPYHMDDSLFSPDSELLHVHITRFRKPTKQKMKAQDGSIVEMDLNPWKVRAECLIKMRMYNGKYVKRVFVLEEDDVDFPRADLCKLIARGMHGAIKNRIEKELAEYRAAAKDEKPATESPAQS